MQIPAALGMATAAFLESPVPSPKEAASPIRPAREITERSRILLSKCFTPQVSKALKPFSSAVCVSESILEQPQDSCLMKHLGQKLTGGWKYITPPGFNGPVRQIRRMLGGMRPRLLDMVVEVARVAIDQPGNLDGDRIRRVGILERRHDGLVRKRA
jgi:hypothetical protein